MPTLPFFQEKFNAFLEKNIQIGEPRNLYEPFLYIMKLGGKRLRPALTLMVTDLLGGDYRKALHAALAVEVFHNFSLVHDDIMDEAPLRRGKETVHEKWDVNTGILSGDAMLICAYRQMEVYNEPKFKTLLQLFNSTALKVCEGQQYDMDFETREEVSVDDYMEMISNKTAILIAAALKMGAIIADADEASQEAVFKYGMNLGIAFQLQDDYLDAFGDTARFGKQLGGDIIENKKTYLYLKAKEMASEIEQRELSDLYSLKPTNPDQKVQIVRDIFINSGTVEETKSKISSYTSKAFKELEAIADYPDAISTLTEFGNMLMKREV